jgi:hypothetical protein
LNAEQPTVLVGTIEWQCFSCIKLIRDRIDPVRRHLVQYRQPLLPVVLFVSLAGNQNCLLCVTSEAVRIRARRFSLATPQFKAATHSEYLDLNCSLDHFLRYRAFKE